MSCTGTGGVPSGNRCIWLFISRDAALNDRRWSTKGVLYLTNMRMVFVANGTHAESGVHRRQLPLSDGCP